MASGICKQLLVQIALNYGKSDKYLAKKKRRGGNKAVIAIARKLLTAIWHILSKNEVRNAELYRKIDKPPEARVFTTTQAVAFLRNKGFVIADETTGEVV